MNALKPEGKINMGAQTDRQANKRTLPNVLYPHCVVDKKEKSFSMCTIFFLFLICMIHFFKPYYKEHLNIGSSPLIVGLGPHAKKIGKHAKPSKNMSLLCP